MEDEEQLRTQYLTRQPQFSRAAKNIREAVELLISDAGIPILAVVSRVKDVDSFLEKCERKAYKKPFEQNTDFVGVRVLTYLPGDVDRIIKLLSSSFSVVESNNKAKALAPNQFGYRSHHLIVRAPAAWAKTPNYAGLASLAVEVQVRTILMHAWAEIEHKLQYKSVKQVPQELQRRLFMLSAKVEEADGQFEALVAEVEKYRSSMTDRATKEGAFDVSVELNLDSLKAYLIYKYPALRPHDQITQNILDEAQSIGLTLSKIAEAAEKFSPFEKDLERLVRSSLSSGGVLGYALEVFIPKYRAIVQGSDSRKVIVRDLLSLVKGAG